MRQLKSITELKQALSAVRADGKTIALVPTMGNLHQGHLSLVGIARQRADIVVASILVNPTQFVAGEDFANYPRTLLEDLDLLKAHGVDFVFTPDTEEMYTKGAETEVIVPSLDNIYCGAFRPGHFKGVATIVCKLLNLVNPEIAVFGEKDYQQLLVIKRLVRDLSIPVEILSGAIIREEDGLAMSSRNRYLSKAEREQAAGLYRCLQKIAKALIEGNNNYKNLEQKGMDELTENGFNPDYIGICDADTLTSPESNNLVIIAAAWLGKARLIDNVAVHTYD